MTTSSMQIHTEWSTTAFELPALASGTGPFVRRDVLRTWWEHRGEGRVMLVESDNALLPLVQGERGIEFLGEQDLTDYHSPLAATAGAASNLLASFLRSLPPGTRYRLDSLPDEAAAAVAEGLEAAALPAKGETHEVAAVLELPESVDDWLAAIGKKQRHEVRRKRRRFEAALGTPRLERSTEPEAVAAFAAMHQRASGDKGSFMTPDMLDLFDALRTEAGAVVDLLRGDDEAPVAAAFGFEEDGAYYLYNSAYEPSVGDASPGAVLLSCLVEQAIGRRLEVFDFLKGDEPYKFRHGARARPLVVFEGVVPA